MDSHESTPRPMDDAAILALTRPHPNLLWVYLFKSMAGLFVAPIVFVPLYFKYHTLKYKLDEEGISASWGILFRKEVHLTYKRIQDIHVKRNIVERWLGIGTVELQTAAGSSTAELSLEGLSDHDAVRDFLYRRMRGHAGASSAAQSDGASVAGARTPARGAGGSERDLVALLDEIRGEIEGTRRALERS